MHSFNVEPLVMNKLNGLEKALKSSNFFDGCEIAPGLQYLFKGVGERLLCNNICTCRAQAALTGI